jgi:hypothetical protein
MADALSLPLVYRFGIIVEGFGTEVCCFGMKKRALVSLFHRFSNNQRSVAEIRNVRDSRDSMTQS